MADWRSGKQLSDHFVDHGHEMGFSNEWEYDDSAQETIAIGDWLEYYHGNAHAWRHAYYHEPTRRFVVLNLDGEIVSHYFAHPMYVRNLPFSTWP
jgi:hypothetical protein